MSSNKTQLVHEIRAVKTKEEVANIVLAQRISERVLGDALNFLKNGITEIEVADFIKKQFIKYNAPVLSFNPIVAFGKNAANIHHVPGKTRLKKPARRGGGGAIIMFDFGTTIKHYCSDMTRTYFWGEPSAKQKKVYTDVLSAMDRAYVAINKGERRCKVIDKSARAFLAKKYKDNFQHGLGHGVGTVIHEWPNFKPKSEDVLPEGVVMTIEPGIYLKGWGGIRIEDMVLVTKKGALSLTSVPKSLASTILQIR